MDSSAVAASCERVVEFLLDSGIYEDEAQKLRDLNSQNEQRELLELAEHYGNCMAFLDHGELTNKLSAAWNAVYDKVNQDKKHIVRKLRVLEADKNADPGVVESYKARRDRLQQELAFIKLTCVRMNRLKEIPVDYEMQFPEELLLSASDRALLVDESGVDCDQTPKEDIHQEGEKKADNDDNANDAEQTSNTHAEDEPLSSNALAQNSELQ